MENKLHEASSTTETRDVEEITQKSGNIYKSIAILAKRSDQISLNVKEELTAKLEEFASSNDNLEEIFENREQIEISKYYERQPKPNSVALKELLNDEIYVRNPKAEDEF